MFKASIALSLLALFARFDLAQGTNILPTPIERRGEQGGGTSNSSSSNSNASPLLLLPLVNRLPLLFIPSSEFVNRQRVLAQTSSNSACTNSSGFTITSQSDLDALSSCSTVNGNIIITSIAIDTV